MLEFEGVSARWIDSRKMKNKSADDLLGTLECNDMSRLLKNPVAFLKNLDLASCNACNLIFQCALAKWSYFKALYHSIHDDVSLSIWGRIVNKTPGQNTPEKTLQFIEEIPLKNIHQIK